MQSQWFVIHTLAGQEQKVKESIEKRLKTEEMGEYIREVLVPMEKVAEVRNGKKTVTTRKLHPGYVYIDMILVDENQRVLERPDRKSTRLNSSHSQISYAVFCLKKKKTKKLEIKTG